MTISEPPFTIGVEEEYLLVDPTSRDVASDPPAEFMDECERLLEGHAKPEFLRSQIEIGTSVCRNVKQAREELAQLRTTVAEVAVKHGLAPIAASTHPFATWAAQRHTDKERYKVLARDMQTTARRMLICGLHVHVGIDDDELRIDLMNQVVYFLPHLLVLSTSSPFWQGRNTGLMSYRISVFDELPRTGLPERFESWGEYARHVDVMTKAGLLEDATKLWWDVRPSARFPTLEMRIADICSRVDDSVCIAALFICLLSMLYRLRRSNQRWRMYSNLLVNENRWRAQRYGYNEGLVDFGIGRVVPYAELLEEILELVREDAERLDCLAETEHARDILRRGTSAHRQLQIFEAAEGDSTERHGAALRAVVDWLIEEFTVGL